MGDNGQNQLVQMVEYLGKFLPKTHCQKILNARKSRFRLQAIIGGKQRSDPKSEGQRKGTWRKDRTTETEKFEFGGIVLGCF